jgi:tetratricopeptide (TPR) repeat protein
MSREGLRPSAAWLLAGACILAGAGGLAGDFTYDDKAIVRDNPRIHAPERVDEIFTTQYFGGPPGTGTAYRPVLLLSFAIQWWIHGGQPAAFLAVNLAMHVLVTILLAILLLRLDLPPPAAVGAALLFAVHPIHVESVASVVGRGETQAAALAIGSVLLALRFVDGGRRRWLALAAALFLYLLACLTKESAAVAPALLFLCLAWRAEGALPARLVEALRRSLVYGIGCAVVLAGVFRLRAAVLGGSIKGGRTTIFPLENPLAPLPVPDRVLNACLVFFRYLGRLAFPLRLSSDESAWSIPVVGRRDALAWAAALLLAALIVASVARLSRRMPAAFGFLFLCIAALPTANVLFPTGTIFAERLMYLPAAGFCVIAAAWVLGAEREPDRIAAPRVAGLAALVLVLAVRTTVREPVWWSDEALFTNMLRVSPKSAKAHYDYAYMSAGMGRTRLALEHYTKATAIYPGYWDAWAGRGRMEQDLGRPAAAEAAYAESLRIAPAYENGFFGLGRAREDLGDLPGAERAYRDGLKKNRQSLPLAYRLALLMSVRKEPTAGHAWLRALAMMPGSLPTRLGYAEWLRDTGRPAEARKQARDLLRRSPGYRPAARLLAELDVGPAAAASPPSPAPPP